MLQKYEPFDSTPVLLQPRYGSCNVGVRMTENLGHSMLHIESVSLTGRCTSLLKALEKNYLAMDASTNLYQRFRLISILLENLQLWEVDETQCDKLTI